MNIYVVKYSSNQKEIRHSVENSMKNALRSADIIKKYFSKVWIEECKIIGSISVSKKTSVDVTFVTPHMCP